MRPRRSADGPRPQRVEIGEDMETDHALPTRLAAAGGSFPTNSAQPPILNTSAAVLNLWEPWTPLSGARGGTRPTCSDRRSIWVTRLPDAPISFHQPRRNRTGWKWFQNSVPDVAAEMRRKRSANGWAAISETPRCGSCGSQILRSARRCGRTCGPWDSTFPVPRPSLAPESCGTSCSRWP